MLTEEERDRIKKGPLGTIIVSLDGHMYTTISLKDFKEAIARGDKTIITPLTYALDMFYVLKGYRVIVESNGKRRCINDMLLGDIGPNEKELRISHNIEKMILSGVYDIETDWNISKEWE